MGSATPSWLQATPEPTVMRKHHYLQLREPFLAVRGHNVAEALILSWASLQIRYELARIGHEAGAEAHSEALAEIRRGARLVERQAAASTFAEQELLGAFSVNTVRKALANLVGDGLLGRRKPKPGSHDGSTYWLVVPKLQAELRAAGYAGADEGLFADPEAAVEARSPDLVNRPTDLVDASTELDSGPADLALAPPALEGAGAGSGARDEPALAAAGPGFGTPIDRLSKEDGGVGGEERSHPPLKRLASSPLREGAAAKMGIPPNLLDLDLSRLPALGPYHEDALALAERWAAREFAGLLIVGPPGSGKSTLAGAALMAHFGAGKALPFAWIDVPALPSRLHAKFDSPELEGAREQLGARAGLALDDLCEVRGKVRSELEAAINLRIQHDAPLLVTTSIDQRAALADAVGEVLLTRITRYCELAELRSESVVALEGAA